MRVFCKSVSLAAMLIVGAVAPMPAEADAAAHDAKLLSVLGTIHRGPTSEALTAFGLRAASPALWAVLHDDKIAALYRVRAAEAVAVLSVREPKKERAYMAELLGASRVPAHVRAAGLHRYAFLKPASAKALSAVWLSSKDPVLRTAAVKVQAAE